MLFVKFWREIRAPWILKKKLLEKSLEKEIANKIIRQRGVEQESI
jgi:hypothetical protein